MAGNVINHIPKSKKRPEALRTQDYDHEIVLQDHTKRQPQWSLSPTAEEGPEDPETPLSQRQSTDALTRRRTRLRNEVARRRYARYQNRGQPSQDSQEGDYGQESSDVEEPAVVSEDTTEPGDDNDHEIRGRPLTANAATFPPTRKAKDRAPESAIDILYENQRGGFLCGMALFSAAALGAADNRPWTNAAHLPSLTDIHTAQVPDPSWEWAWPAWHVNFDPDLTEVKGDGAAYMDDRGRIIGRVRESGKSGRRAGLDDEGWEYSFMFSGKFSWHRPRWWNSYVRRRAWIRKRVRVNTGYDQHKTMEAHMLTSDYFTIHPVRKRSTSRTEGDRASRMRSSVNNVAQNSKEETLELDDIRDMGHLLHAFRMSRIDREKSEAVNAFVANAGDELFYLRERMREVMGSFVFQTSRKLLLGQLQREFDAAIEAQKQQETELSSGSEIKSGAGEFGGPSASDGYRTDVVDEDTTDHKAIAQRRIEYLQAAVRAADEEVKRLEYWSDIKAMAEAGATQGAQDASQGWSQEQWEGLSDGGPRNVITERNLIGATGDGDVTDGVRREMKEAALGGRFTTVASEGAK